MFSLIALCPILLFCRHAGRVVKAAHVAPARWYFITVLLWIAGAFVGTIVGLVGFMPLEAMQRPEPKIDPIVNVIGIVGAIAGGCLAIKLAQRRARRAVREAELANMPSEASAGTQETQSP